MPGVPDPGTPVSKYVRALLLCPNLLLAFWTIQLLLKLILFLEVKDQGRMPVNSVMSHLGFQLSAVNCALKTCILVFALNQSKVISIMFL